MLLKPTLAVHALGLIRIPMILFAGPTVEELDEQGCAVKIRLGYRTKNHLGSMYFGVLGVGADLCAGLNAAMLSRSKYRGVQLVFKDFQANFLKRPEGDVLFRCTQGVEIEAAMRQAAEGTERVTLPVQVQATVPKKLGEEPVAKFVLGLSLKRKG